MVTLCGTLVGCSNIPPSNVRTNATLTPTSGITRDLTRLPKPKARIPVAVYGFRDQTGQFKTSPDSAYSTMVTQGAASILVKALEDSGWYVPVEREGLQNLLTERRIIRAIESPTDKGRPVVNLPNMLPAAVIIEGGVIGYEANVRTGGKGASYLGIGASTLYRVDQVTVGLRSVDVRTGQLLNTVSVTKTIYSYQFSANVYKFTSFQRLLQAETGYTTNEPAQLAVREAIESAVIHLTVGAIRERHFELRDPGTWDSPVIQTYLAEALANVGEAPPDEDALIPMRPLTPDREPVQPWALAVEDQPRPRPSAPTAPAARAVVAGTQAAPPQQLAPPTSGAAGQTAKPLVNMSPGASLPAAPATLPAVPASRGAAVQAGRTVANAPLPAAAASSGVSAASAGPTTEMPAQPAVARAAAAASTAVVMVGQTGAAGGGPASAPAAASAPVSTAASVAPAPQAPSTPPTASAPAGSTPGERPGKGKARSADDDIFKQYWKSR